MKESITALKLIIDFLDQLSEKQLNDLINKKSRLAIISEDSDKAVEYSSINIDELSLKLEEMSTREEAQALFHKLKISKAELKALAKKYSIPQTSKDSNNDLTKKIIETVIGSKLRFNALLNTNLDKS